MRRWCQNTKKGYQEARTPSNQPSAGLATERESWSGTLAAASLEGSGCVLSVLGHWKCRHAGDFFSYPNSSIWPDGTADQ